MRKKNETPKLPIPDDLSKKRIALILYLPERAGGYFNGIKFRRCLPAGNDIDPLKS